MSNKEYQALIDSYWAYVKDLLEGSPKEKEIKVEKEKEKVVAN